MFEASAMVIKEKLIDGDLESALKALCETRYGEHSIIIYPNLDTFRDLHTCHKASHSKQ